jgi:hypothetical protein
MAIHHQDSSMDHECGQALRLIENRDFELALKQCRTISILEWTDGFQTSSDLMCNHQAA